MPSRNIEIKAKLADRKELDEKVLIAEILTGQKSVEIIQHDVFFNASNGRLKLRYEVRELREIFVESVTIKVNILICFRVIEQC